MVVVTSPLYANCRTLKQLIQHGNKVAEIVLLSSDITDF